MLRKSSVWLVVLISVVAVAFIASGCAKKQVIKEEAVARPVVEAQKEEVKPQVAEAAPVPQEEVKVYAPKEEEKAPEVAPQEEAKVPEVAPPEAAFKEEAKEEFKGEAKVVPQEEVKVYAPKEEEKVPEVAPKEEAKEEAKVEAQPEEKPAPFDLSGLRIQFAFDDSNLSSQAKENLEKIASWMSKNRAVKIQIQGNTCDIGTAEYNLALGEKRAMSARNYLERLGVSSSRLSTISYGLERPMFPNTDEANRSKNRRDEFVESK